jgi:hypothetical protein
MFALAPSTGHVAPRRPKVSSRWQERFVLLLPGIRRVVRFALRRAPRTDRCEVLQEAIANAFVAYGRLVARGKEELAYATPLAKFALAQYRAGRRVGQGLCMRDVMSPCSPRRGELRSLTAPLGEGRWEELIVEDRTCSPAEIAILRIDFRSWLKQLPRAKRATARLLATGTSTSEAACRLRVSPARVSQLRKELQCDWQRFQGEAVAAVI